METLKSIVAVHFPDIKPRLLQTALTQFFEIRETPGLKKKPSTSEVLDWLKLLLAEDLSPEDLRRDGAGALPKLHGALLKNEQDVHLFERWPSWRGGRGARSCRFARWKNRSRAMGCAVERLSAFYETTLPRATYDATFAALLSEKDMCGLVADDGVACWDWRMSCFTRIAGGPRA